MTTPEFVARQCATVDIGCSRCTEIPHFTRIMARPDAPLPNDR